MHVSNQIDKLVKNLQDLRPHLTEDKDLNTQKFSDLLSESISSIKNSNKIVIEQDTEIPKRNDKNQPEWVNSSYDYDIENPRKPNMRELMEALSGKTLENLFADPDSNWRDVSRDASEMLYGVVGSNIDTRDWAKIMRSNDVMAEARLQTGNMYQPKVDIDSTYNEKGEIIYQSAVLKDKDGEILRPLTTNLHETETTLINFGASKTTIPNNLEEKITVDTFDENLLAFLINYNVAETTLNNFVLGKNSEIISQKLTIVEPLSDFT